jgi:predicted permease
MRRRVEREMDEEWQFHLDTRVDALVEAGLPRHEAERAARTEFGDPLRWKEQGREARGLRLIHELRSDVQYALRQMRRTPTVTVVITATLAIAIGANTAMFSLVDAVLLKTLPVPHPEQLKQLVWVARRFGFSTSYNGRATSNAAGERVATSFAYPVITHVRDHTTTFSDVFCFEQPQPLSVVVHGGSQLVESQFVSGNFFRGLGVNTIIGRTLTDDDDRAGAPAVAVISHGFWQSAFGGDAQIIGRTIMVNGTSVTIVGVTFPSFFGVLPGSRPAVMLPLSLSVIDASTPPGTLARFGYWGFEAMGRLKPGETAPRAQAETEMLVRQAILAAPPASAYDPPRIVLDAGDRGLGDLRREFAGSLRLLMAIVGAILLVACANIAGLLVVRASARQREIGTRLALGAGRARLIRQLVTESLVLAATGGTLGFAIAYGFRHLLPLFVTPRSATVDLDMTVNARLLLFAAATCLATGVACGVLPAVRATCVDVASLIGRSLSGTTTRAARLWTGKVLIVVQVALSFVLLVGAGLFVRTLLNLRSEALGFQPDRLLLFRMAPSQNGYRADRLNDFYERVLERIATVPGVRVASLSRYAPLRGSTTRDGVAVAGSTAKPIGTNIHYIAPRYFETMGIPLLIGRDVGWQDRDGGQRVAIVNETLARRLFGAASPIGQRVTHPGAAPADVMEVIGVAGDAKYGSLREPAPSTIYEPYRNGPQRVMTFAVRTAGDPETLVAAMREAAATVDPSVPLFDVWTQSTQIDQAIRQERLFANLVSGFALLALLLACLGIYGTLSYSVARRTPEIGLRMALGAGRSNVVVLVLRESAAPVLLGAIIGVATAAAATRVIHSMLFGIAHDDVATVIVALLILIASACAAALIPSMRASRVEPTHALRCD